MNQTVDIAYIYSLLEMFEAIHGKDQLHELFLKHTSFPFEKEEAERLSGKVHVQETRVSSKSAYFICGTITDMLSS